MKFYQENKINPLAGCLPLLVQMPIFLALFNVMRNPYKYIPTSSDLYAAFCTPSGATKAVSEATCSKTGLPNHLEFLGMDLSQHATGVPGGFLDALPYFLLVGLVIATGFLQARQSKRNAPNMNSQMAMVTQILPIGFGLFSLQFPAGLVLYYFVSNLWRLGQQEVIMRKITRPGREEIAAGGKGAIDVKSADKGSVATESPPEDKKPGGLRKLFQPSSAPANGNSSDTPARDRTRRQADAGAERQGAEYAELTRRPATEEQQAQAQALAPRTALRGPATGAAGQRQARPITARGARRAKADTTWSGWRRPAVRSRRRSTRHSTSWASTRTTSSTRCSRKPKAGLFGRLGGNPARVRARVKPVSREKPGERQRRNRRSGSRSGNGSGARGGRRQGSTSADRGGAAPAGAAPPAAAGGGGVAGAGSGRRRHVHATPAPRGSRTRWIGRDERGGDAR